MPDLFEHQWAEWAKRMAAREDVAQRWLSDLMARYGEPQRHYHNVAHIEDLLEKFTPLAAEFTRPDEAIAALYFHDAIYEIGQPDNESRSAQLAREALPQLGMGEQAVGRVATMIEATASHEATGDADADLFIDLDMSILASPRDRYERYAREVMAEFTTLYSKPDYCVGRAVMFLEPMLERKRIFITQTFITAEKTARDNIRWEIDWLRMPSKPGTA